VRILHVIHSVDPRGGGPIEGVRQLSAALAALGVTVDVMSLDAPDAPWVRDFPLPLFALGPGSSGYGYTPRALPWLTQHGSDYDLILINGLWQFSGFAVWLASRKTKLRYAVFPHGMLDPWFKRYYPLKHLKKWLYWPWGEYRVLRDAAAVLFTSEEERLQARQSFWLYRCHERVLGYGIAPPPGDADGQKTLFFQTYPELAGKRLILFLGRIHEKKGCELLLNAFHVLAAQSPPPFGYHLLMAGPGDAPYVSSMKRLSRELGVELLVTWPGMLSGDLKWGAFRASDAFILPSHQENFGVSVVEALACGLPVLISDKVNIWREIELYHAGLVEPDNLAGTRQLLQRWMALSPSEKGAMRRESSHCFENKFQVNLIAQRLISIVSSISN
jgi:glycosyltransferase involved in cell wall biosynthesis